MGSDYRWEFYIDAAIEFPHNDEFTPLLHNYNITYGPTNQYLEMSTEEGINGYEITEEEKEDFFKKPYNIIIDLDAEYFPPPEPP